MKNSTKSTKPECRKVILVAHGSRFSAANLFLKNLAKKMNGDSVSVSVAFLEMAKPHLSDTLNKFGKKGIATLHLIPLFLAPGKHAQDDIAKVISDFKKRNPDKPRIITHDIIAKHDFFVNGLKKCLRMLK